MSCQHDFEETTPKFDLVLQIPGFSSCFAQLNCFVFGSPSISFTMANIGDANDLEKELKETFKSMYRNLYVEKMLLKKRLEESNERTISRQVELMTDEMSQRNSMDQEGVQSQLRDPNIGILDKLRIIESTLEGHKTVLTQMSNDIQTIIASHQLEETMMP